MRALTIWQPQAWAIAEGHKPVENRTWPLPSRYIGETFAIHAGKTYDVPWSEMVRGALDLDVPSKNEVPLGAVIAVATFAQLLEGESFGIPPGNRMFIVNVPVSQGLPENFDVWFSGPYGFLLSDVRKLREPVFCKGAQGLWTLPVDIEKAVMRQLKGVST